MELSDQVGGVLKVGGRLLGGCVVTLPLDEVLEAVIVEATVEYGFDLPLLFTVYNDSRWRRRNLS